LAYAEKTRAEWGGYSKSKHQGAINGGFTVIYARGANFQRQHTTKHQVVSGDTM
jgi:hypothetical protein